MPLYKNKAFLNQKYTAEKLSTDEIAAMIFSSRSTVTKYLHQFGINVRERKAVKFKVGCGLAYGRKNYGRAELANKREQEVIKKMRSLREKGFSYRKVADVLNSMKIPTKTKKCPWSGKGVWQILNKSQQN
jgi:predicted transcriptional regulator